MIDLELVDELLAEVSFTAPVEMSDLTTVRDTIRELVPGTVQLELVHRDNKVIVAFSKGNTFAPFATRTANVT